MSKCKYLQSEGMSPSAVEIGEGQEAALKAANQRIQELLCENKTLKEEAQELKRKKLKSGPSTSANISITNNITNNMIINNNITPPFQQFVSKQLGVQLSDNYQGVQLPDPIRVHPILKLEGSEVVPRYLTLKYMEVEHPNVRIPNVKKSSLSVLRLCEDGNSRWVTVDGDDTIAQMITLAIEELDAYHSQRCPLYTRWERDFYAKDGSRPSKVIEVQQENMKNAIKRVRSAMLNHRQALKV